jgi:hypothetical protein
LRFGLPIPVSIYPAAFLGYASVDLASAPAIRPVKVRFGNLRRLPEDYRGERHRKIVKHLPDRNGQEWVEFEEVPGPAPSAPPEPGVAHYLNVFLVTRRGISKKPPAPPALEGKP